MTSLLTFCSIPNLSSTSAYNEKKGTHDGASRTTADGDERNTLRDDVTARILAAGPVDLGRLSAGDDRQPARRELDCGDNLARDVSSLRRKKGEERGAR